MVMSKVLPNPVEEVDMIVEANFIGTSTIQSIWIDMDQPRSAHTPLQESNWRRPNKFKIFRICI